MGSQLPRKKNNIEMRKLGKECLLYDEDSGKIHHMNPTATFIWEKCDECTTMEELLAELKKNYPKVEPERLEKDLNSALENFTNLKLMEVQG
ncbi:MAG: HPr-rel-A system PqqD family peptide chaperone [Candidatus Eremiobacteraeota bacterium]|nr:HPr-rel-A system PqqD family peptide chaperone [Candidatus Eremiobacteraeota bacterium]